jgi:Flp pilus assembly protein TadG
MTLFSTYIRERRGASAVEFALVIPVAACLMLCVMHMSAALYAMANLHFAVEETARCVAVSANALAGTSTATTSCPSTSSSSIQTYGVSRYVGPRISPTFSIGVTGTCLVANQICATGTYNMSLGFANVPITVSAKAYYAHS